MLKTLTAILIFCLAITSWINFIPFKLPEIAEGIGTKFEQIIDTLSLSYIASYLFYIINTYLPERKEKSVIVPWISKKIFLILSNNNAIRENLMHSSEYTGALTKQGYSEMLSLIKPQESPKSKSFQATINGKKTQVKSVFNKNWTQYFNERQQSTLGKIEDLITSSKYVDENAKSILFRMRDSLFLQPDYAFNSESFKGENLSSYSLVFHNYFVLIDELQDHYNRHYKKYYNPHL